jgi:hypothetical protein
MATRYASLAPTSRCSDLPERDVIAALLSRDECALLLARIALIPSARSASRALVALLGRLATPGCTWLEGELAIELFEHDAHETRVRVMSEVGGLRERVVPTLVLAQPLEELVATFEKRRDAMTLLRIERVSSRCVLVLASEESALSHFDISETSLTRLVASAAQEDVDAGWDVESSAG